MRPLSLFATASAIATTAVGVGVATLAGSRGNNKGVDIKESSKRFTDEKLEESQKKAKKDCEEKNSLLKEGEKPWYWNSGWETCTNTQQTSLPPGIPPPPPVTDFS